MQENIILLNIDIGIANMNIENEYICVKVTDHIQDFNLNGISM